MYNGPMAQMTPMPGQPQGGQPQMPPWMQGQEMGMGGPAPMDAQGTNPRDISSALINKAGESPFGGDGEKEEGGVPLWLKGFLQSPYAKWKGESQQAMSAPSPAPAFQPPMQMGQTHQQPVADMNMPPAWAQMSNHPTR